MTNEFDYSVNHTMPNADDLSKHKQHVNCLTLNDIIKNKIRLIGKVTCITKDKYSMFIRPLNYSNLVVIDEVYTNSNLCEGQALMPMNAYVWFNLEWDTRQKHYFAANVTLIVGGKL